MLSSWVMVLRLSKKVHFPQFSADPSKKSIKTINLDVYERSCFALLENGIVYYAKCYDLLF